MIFPSVFKDNKFLIPRRLAAIAYDACIVVALWMVATLVILLMFTQGTALNPGNKVYQLFLFLTAMAYFVGCWGSSGQTIGMAAWKIKLRTIPCQTIHCQTIPSFKQLILRFLFAIPSFICFGLGFLTGFFNQKNHTLYDKLSSTELIFY